MPEASSRARPPSAFSAKRERARIDFRPLPDQKALFEQAAALEGQTLSEFLIRSAEERAHRILERQEVMTLREESSAKFVKLLLDAPAPTEKLSAAFEQHNKDVESR